MKTLEYLRQRRINLRGSLRNAQKVSTFEDWNDDPEVMRLRRRLENVGRDIQRAGG